MKIRGEKWSEYKDIARALNDGAGPVLAYESGKAYTYDGEGHTMFLGVSGSGKSRRGTIPMAIKIIQNKESGVFVDPKGEIYKHTKGIIPKDYEVHVIDFRNIYNEEAEGWNPLMVPYRLYKTGDPKDRAEAEQIIETLADSMYPVAQNTDPFWQNEAKNLFLGAVYTLFECAREEEINTGSLYYMISKGERKFGTNSYLREFIGLPDISENVDMQLHSYVTTASDTKAGIRSCYLNGLSVMTKSKSIRNFLARNDLDVKNLKGNKPTLVYVIIPDEVPIYNQLAGVMVTQIGTHFVNLAEQEYGGKLPVRVNIIIEELGNVGHAIPSLPFLMTASRSRNIRLAFVLQSLEQLQEIYGASNGATIASNADCKVVYRIHSYKTMEEFSKICGERCIYSNGNVSKEALITPAKLSVMETGQALVLVSGCKVKFITWLPDFEEMFDIPEDDDVYFERMQTDRSNDVSFFDICEYVKNEKLKALRASNKDCEEKREEDSFNDFIKDNTFAEWIRKKDDEKKENDERKKAVTGLVNVLNGRIEQLSNVKEEDTGKRDKPETDCNNPEEDDDDDDVLDLDAEEFIRMFDEKMNGVVGDKKD